MPGALTVMREFTKVIFRSEVCFPKRPLHCVMAAVGYSVWLSESCCSSNKPLYSQEIVVMTVESTSHRC